METALRDLQHAGLDPVDQTMLAGDAPGPATSQISTASLARTAVYDITFMVNLYRVKYGENDSTCGPVQSPPSPARRDQQSSLGSYNASIKRFSHALRRSSSCRPCHRRERRRTHGCLITHRGDDAIRLVYVALLPHERNQGHGSCLIQALQTEAASANKPLTLAVSTQNTQAQRFYAASGFRVVNDDGAYRLGERRASTVG